MEFDLKDSHVEYLNKIKKQRTTFFLKALGGLLIIPLSLILTGSIGGMLFFLFIVMILGGIPMIILYIKRIVPLSKDIKNKVGVKLKLQVIRKQFFPLTNEHYLFLAATTIPNVKVDRSTFKHYQEGDYYTIDQSKHSKITFEDYDRYDIV